MHAEGPTYGFVFSPGKDLRSRQPHRRAIADLTTDGRVLPRLWHSTSLAREKAMVVNLEFIRAIFTVEEVLILDPL